MPSMTVWKWLRRQREFAHDGHERLRDRMLRRAVERARDLLPPPRELGARDVRVGHLVDDVVDLAAERVERRDRAAPWRRQEQEAVVEARAALRRLLLAVLVGRHAERPVAERAPGTQPCTSPRCAAPGAARTRRRPTASMRSRMRRPPAITADSSSPSRHGNARTSGRPDCSSARVRAISNAMSARQRSSLRCSRDLRRASRRSDRGPPAAGRRDPCFQSIATSCQKLVSCRPGADGVARREVRRRLRRGTARAAGGRPDWPSAGNSRARRRTIA